MKAFQHSLPLCTFVSSVVYEVQMLEPQRAQRSTKDVMKPAAPTR
jgi:hypothetical protein